MKRICSNCGKEFEANAVKQTCSTSCALARQREAVRQMRAKSGEIYLRWHNRLLLGIAAGRERKSKRERG